MAEPLEIWATIGPTGNVIDTALNREQAERNTKQATQLLNATCTYCRYVPDSRPQERNDERLVRYVPASPSPEAQWVPFDIHDENSNWPPEGELVALVTRGKCMFLGRLVWDAETDPELDDDGLGYSIEDLTHWAPHRFPPPPETPSGGDKLQGGYGPDYVTREELCEALLWVGNGMHGDAGVLKLAERLKAPTTESRDKWTEPVYEADLLHGIRLAAASEDLPLCNLLQRLANVLEYDVFGRDRLADKLEARGGR